MRAFQPRNLLHRPIVFLAAIRNVIHQCKDEDDTVDEDGPVHRCCIRIRCGREEEEHESNQEEQNGENVDEWAEAS